MDKCELFFKFIFHFFKVSLHTLLVAVPQLKPFVLPRLALVPLPCGFSMAGFVARLLLMFASFDLKRGQHMRVVLEEAAARCLPVCPPFSCVSVFVC